MTKTRTKTKTPAGACFTSDELALLLTGRQDDIEYFDYHRLILHLGCGCEPCWQAVDALPAGAGEGLMLCPAGAALSDLRAPERDHLPPMIRRFAAEARERPLGFCLLVVEEVEKVIRQWTAFDRGEDGSPPEPLAQAPGLVAPTLELFEQPSLARRFPEPWQDLMARAHACLADAYLDTRAWREARESLDRAKHHRALGTGEVELAATLLEIEARKEFLDGSRERALPLLTRALEILKGFESVDRWVSTVLSLDQILGIEQPTDVARVPRLERALDRTAELPAAVRQQKRWLLQLQLADARLWQAFVLERSGQVTSAAQWRQAGLASLRQAMAHPGVKERREDQAWCLLLQGLARFWRQPAKSRRLLEQAAAELEAIGHCNRAGLAHFLLSLLEKGARLGRRAGRPMHVK